MCGDMAAHKVPQGVWELLLYKMTSKNKALNEQTFDCANEVHAYLFVKNKRKIRRFLERLAGLERQFTKMADTYGLMHIGPILIDVDSLLVDPHTKGFKRTNYTHNSSSSVFYLTVGLTRNASRLVVLFRQRTYGETYPGSSFIGAYKIVLPMEEEKLDTEISGMLIAIDAYILRHMSLFSPTFKEYLMSPRDAEEVIRHASSFDQE